VETLKKKSMNNKKKAMIASISFVTLFHRTLDYGIQCSAEYILFYMAHFDKCTRSFEYSLLTENVRFLVVKGTEGKMAARRCALCRTGGRRDHKTVAGRRGQNQRSWGDHS